MDRGLSGLILADYHPREELGVRGDVFDGFMKRS